MADYPGSGGAADVDVTTPSVARVYDCLLGGKDNFAADRAEAARLAGMFPCLVPMAAEARGFLARAVAWAAGQGVRQFLDIGCGLPAAPGTHEAARRVNPSARVMYADTDPMVVTHAMARMSGDGVGAVRADLADPRALFGRPEVTRLITPVERTAVVLGMVLHLFPAREAQRITAEITGLLAEGSYLMISCGSGNGGNAARFTAEYRAAPVYHHSREQITAFFTGLDLVPPGLVPAWQWAGPGTAALPVTGQGPALAGVGCKPSRASRG